MHQPSAAPRCVRLDVPQRFVREALEDVLRASGHEVLQDAELVLHAPKAPGAGWSASVDGRRSRLVLGEQTPLQDLLRVLARGGTPVQAPDRVEDDVLLTAREREVLAELGRCGTTAAAAEQLGISPKTVSNHKESIFRKLGVQSLAQAVAVARRGGRAGG